MKTILDFFKPTCSSVAPPPATLIKKKKKKKKKKKEEEGGDEGSVSNRVADAAANASSVTGCQVTVSEAPDGTVTARANPPVRETPFACASAFAFATQHQCSVQCEHSVEKADAAVQCEEAADADEATAENFELLPSQPRKGEHTGRFYRAKTGRLHRWNGTTACAVCEECFEQRVVRVSTAKFADKEGRGKKLCAEHAREAGTYEVRNPCRDCPIDAKLDANYADEQGRVGKLCALHARKAGTYEVRNPCRDCPIGAKLQAAYKDEQGRGSKLCALHARESGTYEGRNPCRDCPIDAKLEAAYKDEQGRGKKLCAEHAFLAGLKARPSHGASMEACECWDRLARWSGARFANHVHFTPGAAASTGREVTGLIPGRKLQPDDFIPPNQPIHIAGEASGSKGAVYLFHGEEWHGGWPAGHPRCGRLSQRGVEYDVLYKLTLEAHELYKQEGYRVFVVWGLDYAASKRARAPVHIRDVVHEV